MSKPRISLYLFIILWVIVGLVFFIMSGCNYSKMPMREVTEDYRFYNFKVKKGEMVVVYLLAKHNQDFSFIKNCEDYDLVLLEKTSRSKGDGGRYRPPTQLEAIKVYLQPKQSFLLNWTYVTDAGEKNVLYTKIEVD